MYAMASTLLLLLSQLQLRYLCRRCNCLVWKLILSQNIEMRNLKVYGHKIGLAISKIIYNFSSLDATKSCCIAGES
jgi:hypothetical protein